MQLADIFQGLGEATFRELLGQISFSRLKIYQLYEAVKVRTHLTKLNAETLRKASPRLWARIAEGQEDFAAELSQAILVSKLDVVIEVLDFLGIPHNEGFFEKDTDLAAHLSDGWQSKVYEEFKQKHSPALLAFYVNHLAKEASDGAAELFQPEQPAPAA
ncbi:MAG: hypothetical protein U5J83_12375 [Bryobacterales bacterium]|nr:hypothetical protein [Bryobacterales bacterium]